MKSIRWLASDEDSDLIRRIMDRAIGSKAITPCARLEMAVDIALLHLNEMPLRLRDWLNADDFDFFHDAIGIRVNFDRATGQLRQAFLPRFAH